MGYVDQNCRNINLSREGDQLWLSAECRKDNGEYRTSRIDLDQCIGPNGGTGLKALSGYIGVTLTHGGGTGNGNDYRNHQLADGGRKFRCEGQVRQGLEGILPWNWGKELDWTWHEFPLNDHLNNVNGTLEFWAKKHVRARLVLVLRELIMWM